MAIDKAEQQAFLAAIREDWENDTPRLVYADWLEENGGQSEKARAEFIRVQVALAAGHDGFSNLTVKQRAAYGKRQEELQVQHQTAWDEEQWADAPLFPQELRKRFGYDRGMPERLSLWDTAITNTGLAQLAQLAQLQSLSLGFTAITNAGLTHLTELTQLQNLNLVGTAITDAGLAHLAPLSRLRVLYLLGNDITDAGLVHLASLTQLQTTNLSDTRITDAGLTHLTQLTHLKTLDLAGTAITDAGLAHLAPLTHLRWLNVEATHVTLAGLAELAANPETPADLIIATEAFSTTVAALRKRAMVAVPGVEPSGATAAPAQAPEQSPER